MAIATSGLAHPRAGAREAAARRRQHVRRRRLVDLAALLVGLGFGATIGTAVTSESWRAFTAPGGVNTAIGRVAGLSGSYLLLVMVLLMARIPAIERAVGQDRLARWHRRIGGWPVVLIAIHVMCITFGYAESDRLGFWHEVWTFITTYPDLLAAVVAFGLLLLVAGMSIQIARRRLAYETWWAIHLYTYLALSLAFAHQITTGASFVGHPLTRIIWATLWAATAGTALVFRFGLPLWRSLRHQLRVVAVQPEGPSAVSIVCSGRRLERLRVDGGQFFQWRFLTRGLWWQAHPYSLSALPRPPYLRFTLRTSGDHSLSLARIKVGTRVAVEGPYGAFTGHRRSGEGVLLIGAGVGITPLRSILEDLPPHVDVEVIVRASDAEALVLHDELTKMLEARSGGLHEVLGARDHVRFDAHVIAQLVPDVAARDVYICGPVGFAEATAIAARRLGVPEERVHRETFAL